MDRYLRSQQLESGGSSKPSYARRAFAVSARIHHLAATTLSKDGESDLPWIAAERAMQAADQSESSLVLASAARAGTHALLAVGRFDDALSLGETAARWLAPSLRENDPEALSLYGMLFLRTAVAAARRQDRSTTRELLGHADSAADRLGTDGNYWQTGFGPSNVELHRLSAALDLGDMANVVERGESVRPTHLPVERQVTHSVDLARALSMLARDDDALRVLLDAESHAPQLVRHSSIVREVVRTMYRRSPVSNGFEVLSAAGAGGTLQGGAMSTRTLGLIGSAAGGLEKIRPALVEPAIARGWQVAVTFTPTAGTWLESSGELKQIEAVTGLPARVAPRMPTEQSPHPPIDCYLIAPHRRTLSPSWPSGSRIIKR